MAFKIKTEENLATLTDKNLLAYYRAERKRFNVWVGNTLGDFKEPEDWNDIPHTAEERQKFYDWRKYIDSVKKLTFARGNV